MCDDEHLLNEVHVSRLIIEVDVCDVPDFQLAGSVCCYQGIIVIGYGTGGELVIFWMLAMPLE